MGGWVDGWMTEMTESLCAFFFRDSPILTFWLICNFLFIAMSTIVTNKIKTKIQQLKLYNTGASE